MKQNLFVGIVFIVICLCSCEELTETDLSKAIINIIAPIDNLQTNDNSNTFAWENVSGAIKYQIQIVSPKFDSATRFILDSTVVKSSFTYSLSSGKYQWRIKAVNRSTETVYIVRNIIIQ